MTKRVVLELSGESIVVRGGHMTRTMAAWFWFFMSLVVLYAIWQRVKKGAKMLHKIALLMCGRKR